MTRPPPETLEALRCSNPMCWTSSTRKDSSPRSSGRSPAARRPRSISAAPASSLPVASSSCSRPTGARDRRDFRATHTYTAGRVVRGRPGRAIATKTRFGREVDDALWQDHEWETLRAMHAARVAVPEPIVTFGSAILMEYVGEEDGSAPQLKDLAPDPDEAQRALRADHAGGRADAVPQRGARRPVRVQPPGLGGPDPRDRPAAGRGPAVQPERLGPARTGPAERVHVVRPPRGGVRTRPRWRATCAPGSSSPSWCRPTWSSRRPVRAGTPAARARRRCRPRPSRSTRARAAPDVARDDVPDGVDGRLPLLGLGLPGGGALRQREGAQREDARPRRWSRRPRRPRAAAGPTRGPRTRRRPRRSRSRASRSGSSRRSGAGTHEPGRGRSRSRRSAGARGSPGRRRS